MWELRDEVYNLVDVKTSNNEYFKIAIRVVFVRISLSHKNFVVDITMFLTHSNRDLQPFPFQYPLLTNTCLFSHVIDRWTYRLEWFLDSYRAHPSSLREVRQRHLFKW